MGNTHSCVVTSLLVTSTYLFYHYIYRSHQFLKTNVLSSEKLPSFVYLYAKNIFSFTGQRTAGHLYGNTSTKPPLVIYTVVNCRLEDSLLRRFCSVAGYGWDYPDSEFRDIPLCFPEILCCKLVLMLLTDRNFRLCPAGLVRVRQTLKSHEPVDELKKGPFILQGKVLQYQQTAAGVEVDINLSAISSSGSRVWESTLTLLSKKTPCRANGGFSENEDECCGLVDEQENVKQVELRVSKPSCLKCVWSLLDTFPHQLSFRSRIAPPLWMLSVCLAEIEKNKGVEVITAPVNITAHFKESLPSAGKVLVKFWKKTMSEDQSFGSKLIFQMKQDTTTQGRNCCLIVGEISRS